MQKDKQVRSLSFEVSNDLVPVAMVPNFELSTAKARNVLPQHVPYKDAVFNTPMPAFWQRRLPRGI